MDLIRPEGPLGPLQILGTGRDLVTAADGTATEAASACLSVTVDYMGGRTITALAVEPAPPGLGALLGARIGSGFRRTLSEAVPGLAHGGSLSHLLLDELTPAVLISSSAVMRARVDDSGPSVLSTLGLRFPVDVCAGWRAGGRMLQAVEEIGVPMLGWGPPAPPLPDDDRWAWHEMAPLAATSMRRRRLIDVMPERLEDGTLQWSVSVRFRDTYAEEEDEETIVHEYSLDLTAEAASGLVTASHAVPGPLPAPECPAAAASAGDLVGRPLSALREQVRSEFTGTGTCTHLNDIFRSLADVSVMASLVPEPPATGGER